MLHRQIDGAGPLGLADDAARDPVARRHVAGRIVPGHERLPLRVDEARAFASQRFGQQEPRLPRQHQRRRMELDELEISDPGAAAIRHRDAVSGRHRRVGRVPIDVSGAAGRQQDRLRPGHTDRPVLGQIPDPGAAPVLDHQVDDLGVRVRPDPGHGRHPLVEHAADLAAGRIARVQHPPHAVRPLDRQRRLTIGAAVESRPPVHQLPDEPWPIFDERPHRPLVAEAIAGRQGVRSVELGRVSRAHRGGNAALRVSGVAFAGLCFGEDEHVPDWTELGDRPQACDATSDDEIVCAEVHGVSDPVILDRAT